MAFLYQKQGFSTPPGRGCPAVLPSPLLTRWAPLSAVWFSAEADACVATVGGAAEGISASHVADLVSSKSSLHS